MRRRKGGGELYVMRPDDLPSHLGQTKPDHRPGWGFKEGMEVKERLKSVIKKREEHKCEKKEGKEGRER